MLKKIIVIFIFLNFVSGCSYQSDLEKKWALQDKQDEERALAQNLENRKKLSTALSSYDEKDFFPFLKKGTSSITGQVFLKTRGGDVKYGTGNQVLLFPITPFTKKLSSLDDDLLIAATGSKDVSSLKSSTSNLFEKITNGIGIRFEWDKYKKATTADGGGNFEFNNLPAGEYYLESSVFWEVVDVNHYSHYAYTKESGGIVKKQIKISDGESLRIMLTE